MKKELIIGIAGVALSVFGFFVANGNKKKSLLDETMKDVDTSKLTISKSDAQDIANRLYLAMKDMGTDETAIENMLLKEHNLSSEDMKLIVSAFGTKKYGKFGAPMFEWMGGDDLDLRGWLYRECSDSLYEKLNIKFKQAGFTAGTK